MIYFSWWRNNFSRARRLLLTTLITFCKAANILCETKWRIFPI